MKRMMTTLAAGAMLLASASASLAQDKTLKIGVHVGGWQGGHPRIHGKATAKISLIVAMASQAQRE